MNEHKIKAYFNTKQDKLLSQDDFKKVRVGVYGVCVKDGKILTVKVFPNNKKDNAIKVHFEKPLWDIPGGGIELGETVEQALRREFLEETGVQIEIRELWHVNQVFYCNAEIPTVNIQIYYLARLENENFDVNNQWETSEVKWNDFKDLSRKNSLPGLYQLVDKIKKELL